MGGHVTQDRLTTLPFTFSGETWVIDPSVLVFSSTGTGVFSSQNFSVLTNNGNIYSEAPGGFGVHFDYHGSNGTITNNIGSTIKGDGAGVLVDLSVATITNHGTILSNGVSGDGVVFGTSSSSVTLYNDGKIYGSLYGLATVSGNDGGTINNSGAITSANIGIHIDTDIGLITTINNAAHGTIGGTSAAIDSLAGRVYLTNHGTITGAINLTAIAASDKIVNKGSISGDVHLGAGDDLFDGRGGKSAKVHGEAGIDVLMGSDHDDTLDGGVGGDRLTGGHGKDTLMGGLQADTFVFRSIADSAVGAKRDQILDFSHAEGDRIDLKQIDADTVHAGNQAFVFIGSDTFAHYHSLHQGVLGMIRFAGGIVQGNVNADLAADFEIAAAGASHHGDFVL